jgi:hypothetical protein
MTTVAELIEFLQDQPQDAVCKVACLIRPSTNAIHRYKDIDLCEFDGNVHLTESPTLLFGEI